MNSLAVLICYTILSTGIWCFFLNSDEAKKRGFSVVIDMRGSTWHNVKPILRVLQVSALLINYLNK